MNYTELFAEFLARGAPADAVRAPRWINEAYHFIANSGGWPFTEAEATGTAGTGEVAPDSFRKVIMVSDISQGTTPGAQLQRISYDELVNEFGVDDISMTGDPEFWWYDGTDSTIKAYPVGGTIYVRYYKRLPDLAGTDEPAFDAAYHHLIIDFAMVEVYKDDEQFEAAASAFQTASQELAQMRQDYQWFAKEPEYIQAVNVSDG